MANVPGQELRQEQEESGQRPWISQATLACARRRAARRGGAERLAARLALRARLEEELEQARQEADPRLLAASAVASQRFSSAIYAADCSLPLRLVAETALEVRRRTGFHGVGRRLPSMAGHAGSQHVLAMASIAAGGSLLARRILMERRANMALGR